MLSGSKGTPDATFRNLGATHDLDHDLRVGIIDRRIYIARQYARRNIQTLGSSRTPRIDRGDANLHPGAFPDQVAVIPQQPHQPASDISQP
jgi:hypothetical protein